MSQPLQYSLYDEQPSIQKNNKRNRTYKKKPVSKKVQNFLESMENQTGPADFSDSHQDYPRVPMPPLIKSTIINIYPILQMPWKIPASMPLEKNL